jgi:hypothetical protein
MYQDRKGMMQGINMYCPAMQYCASLAMNECNTFSLGKPAVASATAVQTALVTNTTVGAMSWLTTPWVADTPYGRPIQVTPSASATTTIDVWGEDYLGQPMVERFAFAASAAAVVGKKSFYRILGTKLVVAGGAITLNIGTVGQNLGLPFKGTLEWIKEGNPPAMLDPSLAFGKTVLADVTDPATATTGDPRGQLTTTAAPDGVKEFVIGLRADATINSNNNGGLHGIKQFAA